VLRRCRNTPLPVARKLRQEAHFGCCRCGHPLLDNAHIIPYNITEAFPVENMLALCPTCHRIADDGDYSEQVLRRFKANPYNKSHVGEAFLITNENLIVNMGASKFIDTPRVLVINDAFELISVKRGNNGDVLLDVNFYNKNNDLVAKVTESLWEVYTGLVWDLDYHPKELTIRDKPRDISFSLKIENGEIFITGTLYFKGFPIIINSDEVRINGYIFRGVNVRNARSGINCNLK
jgi:hypothetical protein